MFSKTFYSVVLLCASMQFALGMDSPKCPPLLPPHIDFAELCGKARGMDKIAKQLDDLWKNLLIEENMKTVAEKTNKIFRIKYIQLNKQYMKQVPVFYTEDDQISDQESNQLVLSQELDQLCQNVLEFFIHTYCASKEGIPVIQVLKAVDKELNESPTK